MLQISFVFASKYMYMQRLYLMDIVKLTENPT